MGKYIVRFTGRFQEPNAVWIIEAWHADGTIQALSHSELSIRALADLQRLETREQRKFIAHYLFNHVPTHHLRITKQADGVTTWLANIGVQIKGNIDASEYNPRKLSADEQIVEICRFWKFLLSEDDDGSTSRSKKWMYAIAGYDATLFWASAILSKYCGFWGIQ